MPKQMLIMDRLADELMRMQQGAIENFNPMYANCIIGAMRHTVQHMIRSAYYAVPGNGITVAYPMVEYRVPIISRLVTVEANPTQQFYELVNKRKLEKVGATDDLIYKSEKHREAVQTFDRIVGADARFRDDARGLAMTDNEVAYFHVNVVIAMAHLVRKAKANDREALAKELFSFGGHLNFQL